MEHTAAERLTKGPRDLFSPINATHGAALDNGTRDDVAFAIHDRGSGNENEESDNIACPRQKRYVLVGGV